jgi:hypothetical protein
MTNVSDHLLVFELPQVAAAVAVDYLDSDSEKKNEATQVGRLRSV